MALFLDFNCGLGSDPAESEEDRASFRGDDPCRMLMIVGSVFVLGEQMYQYWLIHKFAEECNHVFDIVMGAIASANLTIEMAADPNRDKLLTFKLQTKGDNGGGTPGYGHAPGHHWW